MKTLNITTVRAQLQRRMQHLSREAWLAAGLMVLSLGFYLAVLAPAQTTRDQLQRDLAAAQQQARNASASTLSTDSPAEQLASFYKFFPGQTTAPQWLNKIYSAARHQGLQLSQGDYHATQENSGRLLRYQITLPVKGSYSQLRHFIDTVLSDIPHLALNQISFERQKIGESTIEGKIKFTLYLDRQA